MVSQFGHFISIIVHLPQLFQITLSLLHFLKGKIQCHLLFASLGYVFRQEVNGADFIVETHNEFTRLS